MEPTGVSPRRLDSVTPTRLTEVALCAAATVAGGLVYGRFFAGTGYLLPVCVAALAGAAIAAVAGLLRWRTTGTLLLAVAGFVLLASYGVFRDTLEHGMPSVRTASELVRGVLGGSARMFTVAPPADLRGDLLVTPVLITWAAAFTATTLVLRTRTVFVPAVPALAAFAAALVFVGRQAGVHVTATAVLVAATLSLLLLRTNRAAGEPSRHRRVMTSRLAFGGPVVAVAASLGVLGGLVLPLASGEQRFDPRTLLSPSVRITDMLTPLADLKRQLREEPARRLFTARITGDTRVDRVRVAALDEFDGVVWTSTDRFLVAGRQLAVDPALTGARTVSARITVEDLDGPFLPVVGWPVRLDLARDVGDPVGFSTTSGVLASSRPRLRGIAYDLVGKVTERGDGLLRASPSTAPEYRAYTTLPDDLPPLLGAAAQQLTATESTPYGKLVAIEEHLRGLPYQLDTRPGHSFAALVRLLTGNGEGYAEQRASAFAVLARAAGFPARVAVGYRLGDRSTGTHQVTTRDAHAWAEVHFDGHGWVAFEPTGSQTGSRGRPDRPAAVPRPPGPPADTTPPAQRTDSPSRPGADRDGALGGAELVAVVLAAVAVLGATAILARKAFRRRRRRTAAGNAVRVVGAWREATDRLVERGVPVPVSLTAREAAERAVSVLGAAADALVRLAPLATAAVYAPDEPDDHVVEQAWQLEAQLRRRLYPRRVSVRRLMAGLDPRPLLGGRRSR
jgi:transglutaminase-like putative cysteine protease